MPSSMTKISSVAVGAGGSPTISFTNIPQTYTDLVIKLSARSTSGGGDCTMIFNGSSTAAYSGKLLYGDGSAAASTSNSSVAQMSWGAGSINRSTTTSSTFASTEVYITNYASTSNYKSVSTDSVEENNATQAYSQLAGSLWSNTAAITSITLTPSSSGSFVQYSTATLYGIARYSQTGTGSKATGGTVTTAGGYTYHTFFSSGMFTPTASITGAEVLVVAGGGGAGGGSSWAAGGGGAGGLVYASSQSFTSGTAVPAIVGAGGLSGFGVTSGRVGTNSAFGSLTVAIGGGGGGGYQGGGSANYAALTGGSGGGGPSGQSYGGSDSGAAGTAGQGNAGGSSYYNPNMTGGGGGGAGAAGSNATTTKAGNGGAGVSTYSAWGAATGTGHNVSGTYWYAGGGGGSAGGPSFSSTGSLGGNGGGGYGAPSYDTFGSKGLPNTGGGGGAQQADSTASGGSGIIIIRYTT